jgi:hypothetical protein
MVARVFDVKYLGGYLLERDDQIEVEAFTDTLVRAGLDA